MARQRRHTEPLETLRGTLTDYAEIERSLLECEYRGRAWISHRAQTAALLLTYDDHEIRTLHRAMFGELLPWAGQFRTDDRGPGGKVPVPWHQVPVAVKTFTDDLKVWVETLPTDPSLAQIADIVADAHHAFQKIHPFRDTNGRTGRVLDLFLLWITFGFKGDSPTSSPIIEPFPTAAEEDEYYEGLQEADEHRPRRLRRYYLARIGALFATPGVF
jgi:fido (protein-threonine AMPylation protein)